jgi:hypothetical protein
MVFIANSDGRARVKKPPHTALLLAVSIVDVLKRWFDGGIWFNKLLVTLLMDK